MLVQEVVVGWF